LLVDADSIIVTVNIYARALSRVWTKVNIISTIAGAKSFVVSQTPRLTMGTHRRTPDLIHFAHPVVRYGHYFFTIKMTRIDSPCRYD